MSVMGARQLEVDVQLEAEELLLQRDGPRSALVSVA